MEPQKLEKEFYTVFDTGGESLHYFFAPGRVNLIGEHTDYNGGHVLPFAVNKGVYVVARKRKDDKVCLYSAQKGQKETFSLRNMEAGVSSGWVRYPLAVLQLLQREKVFSRGLDIYYNGTLPSDSGLSSSAALEAVTALAGNHLFDTGLSPLQLALLCHRAENEIVGVRCGIMDQFAVILPREKRALLLDCHTSEFSHIPFEPGEYVAVLVHSRTYRSLEKGQYNQKREGCEKSLEILAARLPVNHLCEITPEVFEQYSHLLPPDLRSLVRHAVYEEQRVKKTAAFLRKGNLIEVGRLLKESHLSLQKYYRVTNAGLDILFEEATALPCVLGARMTGAGFGGCTINLVERGKVPYFQETMAEKYSARTGLMPAFYVVTPQRGAHQINAG